MAKQTYNFPSFNELYNEFKEQIIADSENKLRDFTPGSFLDAFAATSATAAQSVMRVIGKSLSSFFIQLATGDDLDRIISDRYPDAEWLRRRPGEEDESLRDRALTYVASGTRGTVKALKYYIQVVKGSVITGGDVEEVLPLGIIKLKGNWVPGVDTTAEKQKMTYELDSWRPAGILISNEVIS